MSDDTRRPFGERGSEERRPFGADQRRRRAPETSEEEEITATTPYPPRESAPVEWEAVEEEPPPPVLAFEDDPSYEDEPANAPPLIKARDRRGKVPGERTILKERPFDPQLEAESYAEPTPERSDAPATQEGAAPARRSTVMIRFGVLLRSLGVMFASAAVVATLFTWWTPNSFMTARSIDQLSVALATQARQQPPAQLLSEAATATEGPEVAAAAGLNNIGIVSGHRGLNPTSGIPDPGAVCPDGLTEAEINEAVATRLVSLLQEYGYQVDLLDEFDMRLTDYEALALVSIHADTCEYINEYATGFKVASFADTGNPEADSQLVSCLIDRYSKTTGLGFHPSVTYDMTQYHTFREIALGTPGVIIETGFMYLDRELLTEHPDTVALGIAQGILCYLRGEAPETDAIATPTASSDP
jgi:N-acetylmuramoyl-L-alanine amidase